MDWSLEVVLLPASDVDRAIAFYPDRVGFELDQDTTSVSLRIAQLTPRDGGTLFGFADPDGNTSTVQQVKARAGKPLIPPEWRAAFGA